MRSVSMARSESDPATAHNIGSGAKLTPTSPLVPLEQLLQQDQGSGNFILLSFVSHCYFEINQNNSLNVYKIMLHTLVANHS